MAPTAARRARPVQRNRCQGLQGNPDACHPGRGSACDKTARKTCGNARLVFAGQLQPTAAMSPRIGGPGWAKPPGLSFPPLSFGKKAVPRPGRPALRGAPSMSGRPQAAPTDGAPGRRAPRISGSGKNGRILSAPTSLAVDIPAPSGTLTTIETEQERSHAASEHPHDAAISPHKGAAPGLHSVFPAG